MPKSPAKPASKNTRSSSGAKPQDDRRVKHDWSAIRRAYIRGDDTVTYASLADTPGGPSKRQIERRASDEDWPGLRLELRRQVDGKLRELDLDLKTEVRARHAKVGKALITLGVRVMGHLRPEAMDDLSVARLIKVGAELERKALGMEEVNVNFGRIKSPEDLDGLDEATLWRVAGMLPPGEDDDPDL